MKTTNPIVVCARHAPRADPPHGTHGVEAVDPQIYQFFSSLDTRAFGVPPTEIPISAQSALEAMPMQLQMWDELANFIRSSDREIRIFTSPFRRTMQTAKTMQTRWFHSALIEFDAEIQEVGESACWNFYGSKVPADCHTFEWQSPDINQTTHPVQVRYESGTAATDRFTAAWAKYCSLAVRKNVNIILVTHAQMVEDVLRLLLGKDCPDVYSVPELSFVAYSPLDVTMTWSDSINEGSIPSSKKTLKLDVPLTPTEAAGTDYVRLDAASDEEVPAQANRCFCVLL